VWVRVCVGYYIFIVECVLCCVLRVNVCGCVCWTWRVLWVCVFYMRVHFVVECVLDMPWHVVECVLDISMPCECVCCMCYVSLVSLCWICCVR